MSAPSVSVLIPCYNAEHTIAETLGSVLRQTWPHIEVIVIDDGSTDRSVEKVRQLESPKIRLFAQKNSGQTAALNACLSKARGDFIQFLDADDILADSKIELQIRRLVDNPDCVASAEWARFYTSVDEASFVAESAWTDLAPLDWLARSREAGLGMMFPALWLIPRDLVERCGPWREDLTLNNDAEYFTRLLLGARRILVCAGARCYYRSGLDGSLSGRKSALAWASQFTVTELCQQYILAREDSERMRRNFAISWQHFAHACYPYNSALAEEALERASALHDVSIYPDGGPAFKLASRFFGWRLARRMQVASGRK